MEISEKLLEVKEHAGYDYKPLIDFEAWRVAVLKYADAMLPQNLNSMGRHNATDEIFSCCRGNASCLLPTGKKRLTGSMVRIWNP